MFAFIALVIAGIALWQVQNLQSRIARLEHRLRQVDAELRSRPRPGAEFPARAQFERPESVWSPRPESSEPPSEEQDRARPALPKNRPAARIVRNVVPETVLPPEPAVAEESEAAAIDTTSSDDAASGSADASSEQSGAIGMADEPQAPRLEPEPDHADAALPSTEPKPVVADYPESDAEADRFAAAPLSQAPSPDQTSGLRRASINFEDLFGRKLPIWAGGITLAIAGILIVKYAIDIGLVARVFTPAVQVFSGLLFGLGLIGGAEWAWRKREAVQDPRVAQALSGAGISTLYAALLVAANLYHLIPAMVAFVGLALITAGAMGLSLRHGMPSALLGLAGGLAAPALTVGLDANVPMLSVYLAFTIAGLVSVSRMQRWPWLALMALIGGAGWSLWLVLASQALSALGAMSVGTFIVALAIAMPLFAFEGAAARLLRAISAVVGAVQLSMLLILAGFQPLHWGLFVLIAAAGQWLAWRNLAMTILPTLSLALAGLLLLLWPDPTGFWLVVIGGALAAIHAGPLLARIWREHARLQSALELCALAFAIPLITLWHFHAPWGNPDLTSAMAAAVGALLVLGGGALGWKVPGRETDIRFALLLAAGGLLLALAVWLALAHWQAPLWIALIAIALLKLAPAARDRRIEPLAAGFAGLALFTLAATLLPNRLGEISVLFGMSAATTDAASLLRWAGLAAMAGLFAWRARRDAIRLPAWPIATALAYGAIAQMVPEWTLPIAMTALSALLLTILARREAASWESLVLPFAGASVLLLSLTGDDPVGEWLRLGGGTAPADGLSALRWLAAAGLGLLMAMRSRLGAIRALGQFAGIALSYGALAQLVPAWSLPIAMAAVAAAALYVLGRTDDIAAEVQVLAFGAGGLVLLAITGPSPIDAWARLWGLGAPAPDGLAAIRWAALAALFAQIAWRARPQGMPTIGQILAALVGYGAIAQLVPMSILPLVPALGLLALAALRIRLPWPRLLPAIASLGAVSAAWAVLPLAQWASGALVSLGGHPMLPYTGDLAVVPVLTRLLTPALLLGGALWLLRKDLGREQVIVAGAGICCVLLIALHCLYRAGFAAMFGADFTATGLGQRLAWDAILLGLAVLLWQRGGSRDARLAACALTGTAAFHAVWYSLILHNPLWTAQKVGPFPVVNLILPLFAVLPLSLQLCAAIDTDWRDRIDRLMQPVLMVVIAMFSWASLRQALHGTLLIDPGVNQLEDILRSILGIALAVGYLLWGIRARRRSWRIVSLVLMLAAVVKVFVFDASGLDGLLRIGSFIALGFSLIGIGWLYARQLQGAGH